MDADPAKPVPIDAVIIWPAQFASRMLACGATLGPAVNRGGRSWSEVTMVARIVGPRSVLPVKVHGAARYRVAVPGH